MREGEMIETLTEKQEKSIIPYSEGWIKVGRCVLPANRKRAEKGIKGIYKFSGFKEPQIWWFDGPLSMYIGLHLIRDNNIDPKIWSNIGSNIGSNIVSKIWSNIWSNIDPKIWSNIGPNIVSKIWSNIRSNINFNIASNINLKIGSNIVSNIRSNIAPNILSTYYGQRDSNWISYYQWYKAQSLLDYDEKDNELLNYLTDLCVSSGWWHPFENICLISERPETLNLDNRGRLHSTIGPSILFRDGYEIYSLNGVFVPDWIVKTDAGKLDAKKGLELKNGDQKAEFIRKYGIERLKSRGRIVDTYEKYSDPWFVRSKYELIDMSPIFTSLEYAPYLSMLNQTVQGVFHMEPVPKEVKTISEAVEFRTRTKNPKIMEIK